MGGIDICVVYQKVGLGVVAPAFPTFLMLQLHSEHDSNDGKAGRGGEGRLDNASKEFVGFLPK